MHMGYEQKRGDKFAAGVFVPSNCKKGVVINLNKGSRIRSKFWEGSNQEFSFGHRTFGHALDIQGRCQVGSHILVYIKDRPRLEL